MQDLYQTHREDRQTPQERVRGAGVRPRPESGAEEAQSEEDEQVEESVKAAAPHEAKEQKDVGEMEHRPFRALFPLFTQRVGGLLRRHREIHAFEVGRLHTAYSDSTRSALTTAASLRATRAARKTLTPRPITHRWNAETTNQIATLYPMKKRVFTEPSERGFESRCGHSSCYVIKG